MTDCIMPGPPPLKSKAAQLLELFPKIEGAVSAGYSHASIHEYLVNSQGIDLTFRYYELTLCRIRKKRVSEYGGIRGTSAQSSPIQYPVASSSALPIKPAAQVDEPAKRFIYDVKKPVSDFFS